MPSSRRPGLADDASSFRAPIKPQRRAIGQLRERSNYTVTIADDGKVSLNRCEQRRRRWAVVRPEAKISLETFAEPDIVEPEQESIREDDDTRERRRMFASARPDAAISLKKKVLDGSKDDNQNECSVITRMDENSEGCDDGDKKSGPGSPERRRIFSRARPNASISLVPQHCADPRLEGGGTPRDQPGTKSLGDLMTSSCYVTSSKARQNQRQASAPGAIRMRGSQWHPDSNFEEDSGGRLEDFYDDESVSSSSSGDSLPIAAKVVEDDLDNFSSADSEELDAVIEERVRARIQLEIEKMKREMSEQTIVAEAMPMENKRHKRDFSLRSRHLSIEFTIRMSKSDFMVQIHRLHDVSNDSDEK